MLYELFKQHPVVTTDSRDCPKGSLFFALKGDNFDGNRFALQALEKGCAYAIVDDPELEANPNCILVPDVLTALQQLARDHRRAMHTPIVGITGTNGKTTTKELTAAVLRERYQTLATEGNFNNDIGVPKTLLRLTPADEVAVVEMGASHPGDIKRLVEVVEPDCGLITNVGMAHLQGFGSFEGVVRTKGELYDYLRQRQGSITFIDAANPHLMGMAEGLTLKPYRLVDEKLENFDSKTYQHSVVAHILSCAPFLTLEWCEAEGTVHTIETQLIGTYNATNILAAITVGLHFGVSPAQIDHAISSYRPTNNRSQLEQTEHNRLIVDAYNANPTSMKAAIDNFQRMEVAPKMAILGEMRELGDSSHEAHEQVVSQLQSAHFDEVWLVGEQFKAVNPPFRTFDDVEQVKAAIADNPPHDHYILIKGSNGTRLYQLPPLL